MADIFDRVKAAWSGFTKGPVKQMADGEVSWADPLNLFQGRMFTPYNPSQLVTRQGMKVFDRMRTDDQVKASMSFKKHAVLVSGWEVRPPEGKARDWEPVKFVKWVLDHIEGSLEETLIAVMSFLDYGYSCSEKVYYESQKGPFKNKIHLKAVKDRKPHTFDFKTDEYGNLLELQQTLPTGRKVFPPEKFVIFSHDKEFGNWYGRSDLEAAYRPWWCKVNTYQWFTMYLERLGIPPIFALYDPNAYNTKQKNDLKSVITNMQAATSGILPRPARPDGKAEETLDFWTPQFSAQARQVFVPALDMFNRDIARSILMPGLLGFSPDVQEGSFARAKTHFDVFMMVVQYIRVRIEKRIMADQIIKPLVDMNFPDLDEYPVFKFLPITDEVRGDLLENWISMVEKGVVNTQERDEDHIRTLLKFPDREGEWVKPQPRQPNNPFDPNNPNTNPGDQKKPAPPDNKKPDGKPTPFTIFRQPDSYEEQVDFKEIASSLNELEKRTLLGLREILTVSRDALLVFVGRNEKNLNKMLSDLRLKGMNDVQNLIREFLNESFARGEMFLRKEIHGRYQEAPNFRPKEALNWLNTTSVTVSGITRDQILNDVKNELMTGIGKGESIGQMQDRIKGVFDPYLGNESIIRDQEQLQPYRLETIVRTNATTAFNQGRLVEARQSGDFLQAMRYSAVLDERTTEVCRYLDGKIFKLNSPDLDRLKPPRHFNCRSILVAVPIYKEVDESDFITPSQVGRAEELSHKRFI